MRLWGRGSEEPSAETQELLLDQRCCSTGSQSGVPGWRHPLIGSWSERQILGPALTCCIGIPGWAPVSRGMQILQGSLMHAKGWGLEHSSALTCVLRLEALLAPGQLSQGPGLRLPPAVSASDCFARSAQTLLHEGHPVLLTFQRQWSCLSSTYLERPHRIMSQILLQPSDRISEPRGKKRR